MALSDEHARRIMLGIAERYERLVERAEKEKTPPHLVISFLASDLPTS
jgi:hypothetical protein